MTKLTHAAELRGRVSLPLLVSPASDGLQSNTLRPPLVPIACFALAAPSFDFDSSFLVPAMREELAVLARMRKRFRDSPLALFAHADPTGDDEYNKKLSGRRAESVFALLVRQPDIWERLFGSGTKGDRWGRRQLDLILSALSPTPAEPPYLAKVPTDAATSTGAVRRFQRDQQLSVDGIAGPVTRKRMFELYMEHLGHGDADPTPTRRRFASSPRSSSARAQAEATRAPCRDAASSTSRWSSAPRSQQRSRRTNVTTRTP